MPLSAPSLIICICQVLVIWGNGSVFISPFFPCQTVKSSSFLLQCPWNYANRLCLQLLPLPLSKSFPLFELPPLSLSFRFFLTVLCCSWGFQLADCFCMAGGSFVSVCSIHFYFCSLICTGTGFSYACIYSSVFEIPLGHKIFKIFQMHLFIHFHVEHMWYIVLYDKITWQPFCTIQILKDQGQIKAAAVYVSAWAGLLQTSYVNCILYVNS